MSESDNGKLNFYLGDIMKHKIIAVWGTSNTGKTETIKKVYELRLKKYPAAKEEPFRMRVDIKVVITIDGIKIGIESQGDPNGRLDDSLKCFVKKGCNLIICATRTSGMTVNFVQEYEPPYTIKWREKLSTDKRENQRRANGDMARKIMSDVQQFINTH